MADPVKISDTSISMEKVTPAVTVTNTYERGFIESQIVAITAQRDAYVAQRNIEIKECEDILKAMDDLGVITKPIDADIAEAKTIKEE